jgi:asparagine synthetase B (glutamine-hydrolysing)
MVPHNHLVGWMVIVGMNDEHNMVDKVDSGLNAFIGDYGLTKIIKTSPEFGFGMWKPETPLPLTTWSFFQDQNNICFVEGVFYDDYFFHSPKQGEDEKLAKMLLLNFDGMKNKAIEGLNGSFSGFIFDCQSKKLITFVDRLGTKVLYWTYEKRQLFVLSNLAALRKLKTLSIDKSAAFQFLTIGFPIDEKTLLKDVYVQLPCSMNIFTDDKKESLCYWNVPDRMKSLSLQESIDLIVHSMESFVDRISNRIGQKIGLGLSGGHDSRIVLSALAYRKIPFEAIHWNDFNFNDAIAPELCSILNKQLYVANDVSEDELMKMKNDSFVYSDGYSLHDTGFTRLSILCFRQGIQFLMLGFSGDRISGFLSIPSPQYLKDIRQLAKYTIKNQMELLSFKDALRLVKNADLSLIDQTMLEWLQSFTSKSSRESLSAISFWQGLSNRNLKSVRYSMVPAMQYTQVIYPYLDNIILNSYFSLPMEFINNQKAHCYAGFHRFNEFGRYQACTYPISLAREASFTFLVHALRVLYSDLRGAFSTLGIDLRDRRRYRIENYEYVFNEILRDSIFNCEVLKSSIIDNKLNQRVVRQIHTLCRFYDFYICEKQSFELQDIRWLHS